MRIGIEGLAVRYDSRRVIDDLRLAIEEGTFFTLLGPSGCGKTTLLRAIAGFVPIEAGKLMFGSSDVTRLPAYKRNIGMVFQDYALFPDKTVFDNVAYGLRARRESGAEIKKRVEEGLERVGLAALANRVPAALSGGQRQRVALARALVIKPDVLLMDEPLSNLDAKLRQQVRTTISELQREAGITTIFVTHDQDEALAMSDRIGVMKAGRLDQIGTPVEIYRTPRTAYVADFIGAANVLDAQLTAPVRESETAVVSLADRTIRARAAATLPAGHVKLIVRPEDVTVRSSTDSAEQAIEAQVVSRQYLGAKTSYVVRLTSGETFDVDCWGATHDAHAVGDRVALSPDPARALVLAP